MISVFLAIRWLQRLSGTPEQLQLIVEIGRICGVSPRGMFF